MEEAEKIKIILFPAEEKKQTHLSVLKQVEGRGLNWTPESSSTRNSVIWDFESANHALNLLFRVF